MATAMQKLHENYLSCIICTELYKNPCTLHCGHTFCSECLIKYTKTQQDAVKAKSILCPNCRQMTKIQDPTKTVDEWVKEIKPSFLIQGLLDDFASAEESPNSNCFSCLQHNEKTKGTSHCLDCDIIICDRCVKTHRALPGTSHHVISDLAGEVKVRRKRKVICRSHNGIIEFCCKDCGKAICQKCCILDHRKCDNVVAIESMVPEMTAMLKKSKEMMTRLLQEKKSRLAEKQKLLKQFEGSMTYISSQIAKASRKAVNLVKLREKELMVELGDIQDKEVGNVKGQVKSEENDIQMYQQHSEFIEQALTTESEMDLYEMYQMCQSGAVKLTENADIQTEISPSVSEVTFIEEMNQKMTDTHFKLGTIRILDTGLHPKAKPTLLSAISIKTENDTYDPDPFDVTVLEVDGTEVVVVTDHKNNSLKSFYRRNKKSHHSTLDLNNSPSGITQLDQKEFVAVSFWSHNEIVIVHVTPRLVALSTIWTQKMYRCLAAMSPSSLAVCCQPSLDFVDINGHVFQSLSTVPTVATLVKYPYFICKTAEGNILVSDSGSHSVYCLTKEGNAVFTFQPTGKKALKGPRGITTSEAGDILVADYGNNRVLQLSSTGVYVRDILTSKNGIVGPYGICLHGNKLYVAQANNNVKVFNVI